MDTSSYKRLWEQLKSFLSLKFEDVKLTVAEKFTLLATAIAVCVIAIIIGAIVVFFVSVALADLLATAVGPFWANMIIAGAYLLLLVCIILLRKPLITDPVARFITRLFCN